MFYSLLSLFCLAPFINVNTKQYTKPDSLPKQKILHWLIQRSYSSSLILMQCSITTMEAALELRSFRIYANKGWISISTSTKYTQEKSSLKQFSSTSNLVWAAGFSLILIRRRKLQLRSQLSLLPPVLAKRRASLWLNNSRVVAKIMRHILRIKQQDTPRGRVICARKRSVFPW